MSNYLIQAQAAERMTIPMLAEAIKDYLDARGKAITFHHLCHEFHEFSNDSIRRYY